MKKGNVVSIISCLIISSALVFAMLSDTIGPVVSSLVTTIITTIGSIVIWIQLKRTGVKDSADLIQNMNSVFLQSSGLVYMRDKFASTTNPKDYSEDGLKNGKDETYDIENVEHDDSVNIIEYLEFFENLAAMYQCGTVSIAEIDGCFGFNFFVAMNNRYLQERELIPYKEHYQAIIKLYKTWLQYRQKRNIEVPYSESLLDADSLIIGDVK